MPSRTQFEFEYRQSMMSRSLAGQIRQEIDDLTDLLYSGSVNQELNAQDDCSFWRKKLNRFLLKDNEKLEEYKILLEYYLKNNKKPSDDPNWIFFMRDDLLDEANHLLQDNKTQSVKLASMESDVTTGKRGLDSNDWWLN